MVKNHQIYLISNIKLWFYLQLFTNGVKSLSCLIPFDQFDIVKGFSIDYMHCVLLGVLKGLILCWTSTTSKKEPFYIKKLARSILNQKIESLKLCNFITRKPRSLDYVKLFKANEFRSLQLYVLPIALKGILSEKYYSHFCLLSSAVYKLLEEHISLESLESIENDLITFVTQFEILYGVCRVTMNIHRLLHLVEAVRYCGPLWASSVFHFESNNGQILRYINGTTDILMQIATKYCLKISQENDQQNSKYKKKAIVLKNPILILLDEEQQNLMRNLDIQTTFSFRGFTSMNYNGTKYTSINYTQAKRTADYLVRLNDGTYAKVLFYFEHPILKELMMIERLEVKETFHQFKLLVVDFVDVVETHFIEKKIIYIKQDNKQYAVERPNRYEKD